jgi:hypothetical protein
LDKHLPSLVQILYSTNPGEGVDYCFMPEDVENKGPRTTTSPEEKIRRFDFINGEFMSKYLDLVWYARANPEPLEGETKQLVEKQLRAMEWKYPDETRELLEGHSGWQHGFNSGVLAYSRFLATYCEDTLWELGEINEDIAEHEKVIVIDGVEYIEFDGREDAVRDFPELYT